MAIKEFKEQRIYVFVPRYVTYSIVSQGKSLKNRGMRLAPELCSDWLNLETVNLSEELKHFERFEGLHSLFSGHSLMC